MDASSGQNVHSIDFSRYRGRAPGFTLVADGETSQPFDIGAAAYEQLRTDALKFYYPSAAASRSTTRCAPATAARPGTSASRRTRATARVPCQPGVCDYTLDVTGGWYDAGDHGKYVVNGGISTWQLLNQFERTD